MTLARCCEARDHPAIDRQTDGCAWREHHGGREAVVGWVSVRHQVPLISRMLNLVGRDLATVAPAALVLFAMLERSHFGDGLLLPGSFRERQDVPATAAIGPCAGTRDAR